MIWITGASLRAEAQKLPLSQYGLPVVNQASLYSQTLVGHPEKQMQMIRATKNIRFDLRYATTNNFTHERLYPDRLRETFLRRPVALALDSVVNDLEALGLGILIFDAYRPYYITVKLWEKERDDRYAADPAKGSGHNRGIAVDLTLFDLKTGHPLEMPTGFDNFTDSAHQDFMRLSESAIRNRRLLKTAMENRGFIALSTEWWHFTWPNAAAFEVLDLSFDDLKKLTVKR